MSESPSGSRPLDKMTVPELKSELSRLGLSQDGLKAALVSRLREALSQSGSHEHTDGDAMQAEEKQPAAGDAMQAEEQQPAAGDAASSEVASSSEEEAASSSAPPSSPSSSQKNGEEDGSSSSSTSRKRNDYEEGGRESRSAGVLVTSVPNIVPDSEIRSVLGDYGEIKVLHLLRARNQVVVIFASEADAAEARHRSRDQYWPSKRTARVRLAERPESVLLEMIERDRQGLDVDAADGNKRRRRMWPDACPDVPSADWTATLHVENLQRPLSTERLRELLDGHGTVTAFWIDQIKTHCYVTYESPAQAETARRALYGYRWPETRPIFAEFATAAQMKADADRELQHAPAQHDGQHNRDDDDDAAAAARRDEEREPGPQRRPTVALTTLYNKTRTHPHIWWKPCHSIRSAPPPRSRRDDRSRRHR